jgi:hypothetical protein
MSVANEENAVKMSDYDEGFRAGMQIVLYLANKRIEDLEAKLAECEARLEKAVELSFDECPFRDGTGSYNDWWHYRRKELEALKRQNDE